MFDIRWIREEPQDFDKGLARRGLDPAAARLIELDRERRAAQTRAQELRTRRNQLSTQIGRAKAVGGDAAEAMEEVARSKGEQAGAEETARRFSQRLDQALAELPNLAADEVPDGADETDNEEIRQWGTPPRFDFEPKEHFDLGEGLGLMDFAAAVKLSGARFVVLKGPLARLERALAAFMLDIHTGEFGYTEVAPPVLVRDAAAFGTGQLPKFADDLFRTHDGLWMIPTAEVPLTNLVAGEIIEEAALPLRYVAHTVCFRAEAGAAGKDTRGMIRQHQFNKVEMVSITHPDSSPDEHPVRPGAERFAYFPCTWSPLQGLGMNYTRWCRGQSMT
ncbi:MAG: serine--tRNA ligase [Proteobacteria bacterium]|nr:serine--tRNA ligase [Pseudomonadota bacterium]